MMAVQIVYATAQLFSIVVLLTCLASSVAVTAVIPEGAVRSSYAPANVNAAEKQIMLKRSLMSNAAMNTSDDANTLEERGAFSEFGTKFKSIIPTFTEDVQAGLLKSVASTKFRKMNLNSAGGNPLTNPEFFKWIAVVRKKSPKSPERALGVMLSVLSKYYGPDEAKVLVKKVLQQEKVSSEFLDRKLDEATDELLLNLDFLNWIAFVKKSSSADDAARESFMVCSQHYGYDGAKKLFANMIHHDLVNSNFFRLKLDGDLTKNAEFLHWIAFAKASNSPDDAARGMVAALSEYISLDRANDLVAKGLRQNRVNSEFTHLKLDEATGDLFINLDFLRWTDFVKMRNTPDNAAREMSTTLTQYYGKDRATNLLAQMVSHDLANSRFVGQKLKGTNDLLSNIDFLHWFAFAKASNSPDVAAQTMFTALSQHYDRYGAKEVFAKMIHHDLAYSNFIRLKLDDDLAKNAEFLNWIAFARASSSPDDAEREMVAALSRHTSTDQATALLLKGHRQNSVNSEFTRLELDLPDANLLGNPKFTEWLNFVNKETPTSYRDAIFVLRNTLTPNYKGILDEVQARKIFDMLRTLHFN